MRVVLDTNIYISAILFDGICEKVLEKLSNKESFICPFVLKEIEKVLRNKFKWSDKMIGLVLEDIKERSILIEPEIKLNIIVQKENDNRILECAFAAKADLLISGDRKHILPLKKFKGTEIISPREFIDKY